jgi:uncharacterized protein YraI
MRTIAAIALAAFALFPVAAEAASRNTVLVTGDIPVRSGPGTRYDTIGTLRDGSRVHLAECTRGSNWCLVLVDGEQVGWARGSFLVGWPAKMEVSPSDFMGGFGHWPRNRDDD